MNDRLHRERNMIRTCKSSRQGAVTAICALFLVALIAFVALGIEVAYRLEVQAELQRAADAAALAACWEYQAQLNADSELDVAKSAARKTGARYAGLNRVGTVYPIVDLNESNLRNGDIVFGRFTDFGDPQASFTPDNTDAANAVRVTVRRISTRNGQLPFLFGRLIGVNSASLEATATAALVRDIRGFTSPGTGSLGVLPFAIDEKAWDQYLQDLFSGRGPDNWTWNELTGEIESGPDGLPELDIYPHDTGASGNAGTVDFGSSNNSTEDLRRQIREGLSAKDLEYHGGQLALDDDGVLMLGGDPGISTGMKDALEGVKGLPRVILLYSKVTGSGDIAQFTCVRFVGMRILEVNFQGSSNRHKRILIQPANAITGYIIPSPKSGTSQYVYSPVVLVR